jgi:hypothetical protein
MTLFIMLSISLLVLIFDNIIDLVVLIFIFYINLTMTPTRTILLVTLFIFLTSYCYTYYYCLQKFFILRYQLSSFITTMIYQT